MEIREVFNSNVFGERASERSEVLIIVSVFCFFSSDGFIAGFFCLLLFDLGFLDFILHCQGCV